MTDGPINTDLMLLIEQNGGNPQVYAAMIEREDNALDVIRQLAAQTGLAPSITNLMLVNTGLGTPMTEEVHALLHQQADVEAREIMERSAAFQRWMQERGEQG